MFAEERSLKQFGYESLMQVAIKFIPRGPSKITKHVEREIINHSNFCHPHVVQFKEVFLTAQFLAIAMVCLSKCSPCV